MYGPAFAQAEGFSEDFEDPSLPGWEKSSDSIVVNGALQMSPGSFALHIGDWSDINLTLKLKYSGEGEIFINYYFRDINRYHLALGKGRISLEKNRDGSTTPLGNAEVAAIQPDTWLDLAIKVTGGDHQISINNQPVLTATDSEPLETGAILFESIGGATAEFDDLDVRGIPGSGPPPGEAPPPGEGPPPGEEPPPGEQPAPGSQAGQAPAAPAVPETGTGTGGLVNEFFASQASTVSLTTFLINLILSAIFAYILSVVYIHWGSSLTNRRKFGANFMLLTVTTTFIILVVRSSVALSLGLVGALSIVRFRAAVKEPEELAYLFFAIGIGIGLGDNQRLITMVAMAAGIVLIGLSRLFRKPDADVNLHLSVASQNPTAVALEQITETLHQHTAKLKLLRFDETPEALEAAYMIEFRRMEDLTAARAALRSLSDTLEITFMDNKGIW
jgi:hypothetical protein